MALKTTRWYPDTCDCVVDFEWDDAVPAEQRTHTISAAHKHCRRHAAHGEDLAAHWAALSEENPRKNRLLDHLRDNFAALTETDPRGNIVLEQGRVSWAFDDAGVLHVILGPPLTGQQKTTAQRAIDDKFSAGKIVLD